MRTFSDCTTILHPEAITRPGSRSPFTARSAARTAPELRPVRNRAFTAIEMIGVLSVIALLAAAIVPNVIRKIDRATWERETSDLNVMANGLLQTVRTDKSVPASNGIAQAIARYSSLATSQVTNTPRALSRVFLVDPNLNLNGVVPSSLPYNQGNSSWTNPPINARMMILSTIARPALVVNPNNFNAIWNTTLTQGTVVGITGGQKADDLCIQRVDMGLLFHKLVLLNIDRTNNGYFTFDSNPSSFVSNSGGQFTACVLDGTALNLYSGGSAANLQVREIAYQDQSFVYQDNQWSRNLSSGVSTQPLDTFGTLVSRFLAAGALNPTKFKATQRATVDEMYSYLWGYWSWGQAGFAGLGDNLPGGANAAPQNPFFKVVYDSQGNLDTFSHNILIQGP